MGSTAVAAGATANCRHDDCLLERPAELPIQPSLVQAAEPIQVTEPILAGTPASMPVAGIRVVAGENAVDSDGDGVGDALDVCGTSSVRAPVNRFGCRTNDQRLATVHFALADAVLSPHSRRQLESVAATLRQYADMHVALAAYTDDSGSERTNMDLSRRRADSVARHLARLGVSPARLIPTPYGERTPVADNTDAMGRAKNRRVEITVLADKQSITDDRLPAAGRIDE